MRAILATLKRGIVAPAGDPDALPQHRAPLSSAGGLAGALSARPDNSYIKRIINTTPHKP